MKIKKIGISVYFFLSDIVYLIDKQIKIAMDKSFCINDWVKDDLVVYDQTFNRFKYKVFLNDPKAYQMAKNHVSNVRKYQTANSKMQLQLIDENDSIRQQFQHFINTWYGPAYKLLAISTTPDEAVLVIKRQTALV